jgi:hypothetical protein
MIDELEVPHNKSMGDLGREALWFAGHTVLAIVIVLLLMLAMGFVHPDAEAAGPKLVITGLSLVLGGAVGAVITRASGNLVGRYAWISGLLIFMAACVWVIDLPTGPGLCQECGPGHLLLRLWRTFFDFSNGSGLMGGGGPLIGCWIPLALLGYAIGSALASNE